MVFSIRLLTVEVRFPITKLHLEIRTIFGKLNFSEILTILPESQMLTRKMAESSLLNAKNALFYCTADHVGSETASTDVYKLMCRMHIPVYLFGGARDDIFVTHHYHDVSQYFFSLVFLRKLKLYSTAFNIVSFFPYRMVMGHIPVLWY